MSAVETRVAAAAGQFRAHFAGADEGYALLCELPDIHSACYDLSDASALETMARDAVGRADRADVYFNVNVLARPVPSGKRGEPDEGDFAAVTSFVVDVDIDPAKADKPHSREQVRAFVDGLPLSPSAVAFSGRGVHLYWYFREALSIAEADDREEVRTCSRQWTRFIARKAAAFGWSFDDVSDLARMMRPAGTLNWKPTKEGGEALPVSLARASNARYLLSDLDDIIPDDIADEELGEAIVPKAGEIVLTAAERLAIVEAFLPYWDDGNRHHAAMHGSGWLATNGVAEASAIEVIEEASAAAGDRNPREKVKTARDAYQRLANGRRPLGWNGLKAYVAAEHLGRLDAVMRTAKERSNPVGPFALTDLGNAERLVAQHGKNIRFCPDLGNWLVWVETLNPDRAIRSGRWVQDDSGVKIHRLAQLTVRNILAEAAATEDLEQRQRIAKHAISSERSQRLSAMVHEAQVLDEVLVDLCRLDDDAWILNCQNGTVDLRSGALRPPSRDDLITRMVPAKYALDAPRPAWDAFLDGVFRRIDEVDTSTRDYVQRLVGYAVSGDPVERLLPILFGSGANGKSTFVETISHTLGRGYADAIEPDLIYAKRGDDGRRQQQIAALRGLRFAPAAEGGEDQRLDSPMVKRLTGRDTLTGRHLYRKAHTFIPTHVLFLTTNHRPKVTDTTKSIWDRLRLIPFMTQLVRPDEPGYESAPTWRRVDPRLPEKLQAERAGVLAWIVEGSVAYFRHGLPTPQTVLEKTKEYRTAEDDVGRFLEDCCVVDPGGLVPFKRLFAAFQEWHHALNDGDPMSDKTFGRRLTEKGFGTATATQEGQKIRVRGGIRLRDTPVTVPMEVGETAHLGTNGTVSTDGTVTGGELGNSGHEEAYSEELPKQRPVTVPGHNGSADHDDIPFPRDAA